MLKQFRIDNLNKLADFLENEITDEQFNISDYRQDSNEKPKDFVSLNDCGSIGCALGWSPFVIPAVDDDFTCEGLSFARYSKRHLVSIYSDFWNYMFSSEWIKSKDRKDFSRLGVVYRIREVTNCRITELDARNVFNSLNKRYKLFTWRMI